MITFNNVAAAPPSNNRGVSAICAFFTAVIVLVTPIKKNSLYTEKES